MDQSDMIVGDLLVITGGSNAGIYPITAFITGTIIEVSGSSFTTATSQTWEIYREYSDELKSFPAITQDLSQLGGVNRSSGLTFSVNNQDLFSSIFATYPNPESGLVRSVLYFDDGSDILISERILFHTGIIDNFPSSTHNEVNFSVKDRTLLMGRNFGANKFDGTELPGVLKRYNRELLGITKPVVYGDHQYWHGHRATDYFTSDPANTMAPLYFMGDDSTKYYWMVANHEIDIYEDASTNNYAVWTIDPSTNRLAQIVIPYTVEYNDDVDGCIISMLKSDVNSTVTLREIVMPDGTLSNESNLSVESWGNYENAADGDMSTYSSSEILSADYIGLNRAKIDVDFSDYENSNSISQVDILVKWNMVGDTSKYRLRIQDNASYLDFESHMYPEYAYKLVSPNSTVASVNTSISMEHTVIDVPSGADATAYTYLIYKLVTYINTDIAIPMQQLFMSVRGRRYNTWINSRTGTETHPDNNLNLSATYLIDTGTCIYISTDPAGYLSISGGLAAGVDAGDYLIHDSDTANTPNMMWLIVKKISSTRVVVADDMGNFEEITNTGSLENFKVWKRRSIENGSGIIESLLRDEMGLSSGDLDEDSFNVAGNDLDGLRYKMLIEDQVGWVELLDPFAQRCRANLFVNDDDSFRLNVLESSNPFTNSQSDTPYNWDIYEYDPSTTFHIVSGVNNKLYIEGGITLTISDGQYTGSQLAAEINTQIDTTGYIGSLICSYSSATGEFTFTDTPGLMGVDLLWTSTPANIGRWLGFEISSDSTVPDFGSVSSDYPLWSDSFVENPITRHSFQLEKQSEAIATNITVKYHSGRDGKLSQSVSGSDTTYHSQTIKLTKDHPYTDDETTAQDYLDFMLDRLAKKHWQVTLTTWYNAIRAEVWDIINVRHPVLEGIFGSSTMNAKKWIITNISHNTTMGQITILAIEL